MKVFIFQLNNLTTNGSVFKYPNGFHIVIFNEKKYELPANEKFVFFFVFSI